MPLPDGSTFAGYTVLRSLGAGGMGEVYLAQHPRLPRRDALKVLPRTLSEDTEYRHRFAREADAVSALWHPHIVGVHDRGEHDGLLWLTMDYVDGSDAADVLRRHHPQGMPRDRVVTIVTAVAEALDYAHDHGVLHRDVKPANILLADPESGRGRVLLADFGIARHVDDADGLTVTNMTVGTPNYAAPEQLLGEALTGRADQYALAATAFHLLTGQKPGADSSLTVLIGQKLSGVVPRLADLRPDLADMDRALAVAMARQATNRFDSCAQFVTALAGGALSTPPWNAPAGAPRFAASPPSPSRKRKALWPLVILGIAGLVAAAVVISTRMLHGHDNQSDTAAPTVPPPNTTVTTSDTLAATSPPTTSSTPSAAPMVLPDADSHGFTTYNGAARCPGADLAAMIVRTSQSALVVCRRDADLLYYLGYRFSDGATIRLDTVQPTADGGYAAINVPDSAQYEISSAGLKIMQHGTVLSDETAVESAP